MGAALVKACFAKGTASHPNLAPLGTYVLLHSVVALLDLADEHFGCSALIIALPRHTLGLDDVIHSLMYVGGQVVTHPPFKNGANYVLIGMEI